MRVQAALVYAEGLLVLQYTYLCIANCMCGVTAAFASAPQGGAPAPSASSLRLLLSGGAAGALGVAAVQGCSGLLSDPYVHRLMATLGLHETAKACLPMFVLYLATLMHVFGSDSQTRPVAAAAAAAAASSGARGRAAAGRGGGLGLGAPMPSSSGQRAAAGGARQEGSGLAGWVRRRARTWRAVLRRLGWLRRQAGAAARELGQVYRCAGPCAFGSVQ